jgi:hypothetical protein
MPAPKKNSNRRLGPEPLDAQVVLRVTRAEKRAWNAAARPGPLAQWVRETLNRASDPGRAYILEDGGKIINPAARERFKTGPRPYAEVIPIKQEPIPSNNSERR